jgi:hypothetical protein
MRRAANASARRIPAAATLAAAALVFASACAAQSVTRGQALYANLGCAASNCHGASPAQNQGRILNGAGSAVAVEYSIAARADKQYLQNVFSSDPTASRDIAAWLATITPAPPAPPATATVVEYHHAAFGHYFVTGLPTEIAALDGGQFAGWVRTGFTFSVYATDGGAQLPVCRFFTVAFPPKSSHFYTPFASECADLKAGTTGWDYEGQVFYVDSPDAAGACATGLRPVYRLYNGGQGGAPNHRYTTDSAVRTEMIGRGWVSEGLGAQGVIFCVPS